MLTGSHPPGPPRMKTTWCCFEAITPAVEKYELSPNLAAFSLPEISELFCTIGSKGLMFNIFISCCVLCIIRASKKGVGKGKIVMSLNAALTFSTELTTGLMVNQHTKQL